MDVELFSMQMVQQSPAVAASSKPTSAVLSHRKPLVILHDGPGGGGEGLGGEGGGGEGLGGGGGDGSLVTLPAVAPAPGDGSSVLAVKKM